MKILKSKGMIFLVIKKPVQKIEGGVQVVYWSSVKTSIHVLSYLDSSKSNICVVTAYKNVKDDETLAFVGLVKGWVPDDDENIILSMIL